MFIGGMLVHEHCKLGSGRQALNRSTNELRAPWACTTEKRSSKYKLNTEQFGWLATLGVSPALAESKK